MSDAAATAPLNDTPALVPGFWSSEPFFGKDYGLFHQANPDTRDFLQGVLLVFIHGINSNATECWESLPEEILTALAKDIDILNFQYAAGLFANTSIPDVASQLRTLLRQLIDKNGYRDLIFIAHSAGGLVVKQMLVSDAQAEKRILSRSRQIFNFAVPHAGSTRGYSDWFRKATVVLEFLAFPITFGVRFLSQGAIGYGRNRILCELKHNGRFVLLLERDYVDIVTELDKLMQPRPESIEISADNDVVADRKITSDLGEIRVRGIHTSLKFSPVSKQAVVAHIGIEPLWQKRRAECDATVAQMMVNRVRIIEQSAGVPPRLIQEDKKAFSTGLDQAGCLLKLRELLLSPVRKRTVVTGPVGVGKSVVLRRLCKEECQRFLRPAAAQPRALVLFFPIDRLMLAESESGADGTALQIALCRSWVKHANELLKSPDISSQITLAWLLDRLQHEKTVVILDGVDEFIANHPKITIQTFVEALPITGGEDRRHDIRIVVGARESLWGLETLCRGSNHLWLSPLGKKTITKLVPDLAVKIDEMNETDKQMLSTPLVILALSKARHAPKEHTATKILQEAVESILEWSNFFDRGFTLEPLALVAWIYYRRFRRELSLTEIRKDAEAILEIWQRHLGELATDDPRSQTLRRCLENLKVAANSERLSFLLRHSFFFPTKSGSYSLSNEGWRDFFVTLYLSLCVRYHIATGLGGIALQVEHYERAGDLLEGFWVDYQLVSSFVSRGQEGDDPFIVGNLASVLGISAVSIVTAASMRVATACGEDMHPLCRFVATSRLAGRAVKGRFNTRDSSAPDIRKALSRALPVILLRPDCDSLMRSLCLCCLRELGLPSQPMVELNADEALDWIRDSPSDSAERARSVQMSFLSAQYTTKQSPERSVAHIHYLFLLTVARIKGWAIPEVCVQLPALLESGSETELHYKTYSSVPEVYAIYLRCQELWRAYASQAPLVADDTGTLQIA